MDRPFGFAQDELRSGNGQGTQTMKALHALAELYAEMEQAYAQVATLLDFSCDQCPDNC